MKEQPAARVASAGRRRVSAAWLALFLALFAATQLPLYAVRYPDIVDLPNHVARLHVLAELAGSPLLQRFYVAQPGIAPNLAMDLLVPSLAAIVGVETAVKIFGSLATLLAVSAVPALSFALHGRLTAYSLGGLLFAHNAFFQLGLFNFLFGVGAALWLLAAWILVRGHPAMPGRLLWFGLATALVWLCHLSAAGVYLIGVLAVESGAVGHGPWTRWARAVAVATAQALPSLCLHLLSYQPGTNLAMAFPATDLASLAAYKAAVALLTPRVAFHSEPLLAAAVAGPCAFLVYRAWRLGRLDWSRTGARAGASIGAAVILLPPMGFGSNMVDLRLALPLSLVAWASLSPRRPSRGDERSWAAGIAAAVMLLAAGTLHGWATATVEQDALRSAMLALAPGSRVAVVALEDESAHSGLLHRAPSPTPHAAAWSVVDRSVMLSTLFIRPFQPFPLAFREEYVPLARKARLDNDAPAPPLAALRDHFDCVVVFGSHARRQEFAKGARAATRVADAVSLVVP